MIKVTTLARWITKVALWSILGAMLLMILSALTSLGPIGWGITGLVLWLACGVVRSQVKNSFNIA